MHLFVHYVLLCFVEVQATPHSLRNVEANSLVLFVRTERTSCARAIGRFTVLTVLREASFLLVLLVLKTKTVAIQYLALKFIATYRVLQYKTI